MSPRRPSPYVLDVLTAVGVAALIFVELGAHWDDGYSSGPAVLNVPLLLCVAAALAVRRRYPRAALSVAYAAVLLPSLFVAHTVFFFGTLLPLLVLTYTCARALDARRWLPTLAWPLLLPEVVALRQPGFDAADYLFWFVLATIATAMGRVMHRLDAQRVTLSAVLATQVRDQDARERALLLDERARIARELHDVVAHAVSVMVVQAGAARLAVGADDGEARAGLLAVEQSGRHALTDLRRLLGVLRPDESDVTVAPAPGLAMLGTLVDGMRTAGLDVDLEVRGLDDPLPGGVDLSAYRIVQEALTNVLKHCGPTHVTVAVDRAEALAVTVTDDGPRADQRQPRGRPHGGHGLIGMRERAAVFGGSFAAGPHGNGWRVSVRLPVPAAEAEAVRLG